MCRTPAPEFKSVKASDPEPDQEEDVTNQLEDVLMESDGSSYTDTSSDDEEASDSDAESSSGHRVTIDMAVWYMLKEEGLLSEEKYAEKKDMYVDNIKSVVPKIPRSDFSDTDDSIDLSGSYDFNYESPEKNCSSDLNNGDNLLVEILNGINKDSAENSNGNEYNVETVTKPSKDNKCAENGAELYEFVHDSNIPQYEQSKQHGNGEETDVTMSERAVEETLNEETILQPDNTAKEEFNKYFNEKGTELEEKNIKTAIVEGMATQEIELMDLVEFVDNNAESENKDNISTKESNETINKETKGFVDTNAESENKNNISTNESHETTNKETKSFRYIIKKLKKENRISTKYEYVDVLKTYLKGLDRHYKNNKAVELFHAPTDELKEFALHLYFYSPSSYKYVTETFNTPLPNHKVLSSWYLKDNDQPGLFERSFNILKKKASKKRPTCALMSRDIYLRNYGRDCDFVDYGGGCNDEYADKAIIVFVFILVSLDEDWKIPIGYVFARDMPAESQAGLISVCLTQCHEAGVDVVAVTLDTPTPAEFLGCSFRDPKKLKTTFKHPECDREVAVWIDPCLALRSVRDVLNVKEALEDDAGNSVRWNLIRKLKHLYSDGTIDFSKPGFLELRNDIAKVGLTTEIFSESLAPALELCEKLQPYLFKDTAPTRRYIEIMNMVYDILNSRKIANLDDVEQQLNVASEYMTGLFCNEVNKLSCYDKDNLAANKKFEHRSFVEGKRACGFIAFLTCIASFKHLYATLVEKEHRMNCINTHKLCKDHADDFVKNIRAYDRIDVVKFSGWNFQNFCDHWFDDLEKNPRFTDQNMSLEQWPLKNKYTPAVTLKRTCRKRSYDEVYSYQHVVKKIPKASHHEEAIKVVKHFTNAMDTEADLADRKCMVGYMAGWIAAKFARCIKCEVCVDALFTDKKLWFHKFITSKDLKGVCLPSEEVFRICWECERALRQKGSVAKLRVCVLRRLANRFPWSSHGAKHHPTHFIHLVRAIITKYIPLRVAAPFSVKDKKKIISMYRLFSCMNQSGLFDQLQWSRQNNESE